MTQDILVSMGILNPQPLGLEGAGIVESIGSEVTGFQPGDRVLMLETGCLATCVKIPANSCSRIPRDLTFQEAATVPCVFATAIHCLMDLGRLQRDETVLIHSACGGKNPSPTSNCDYAY